MAGKTISQTPPFTDEKYLFNLFAKYNLIIVNYNNFKFAHMNCLDSIHDF